MDAGEGRRRQMWIRDSVRRVQSVLARREDLRQLVHNDWVRLVVRDPKTNLVYKQAHGEYLAVDGGRVSDEHPSQADASDPSASTRTPYPCARLSL